MPAPSPSLGLQLSVDQRMVLQPRMLQAVELLQLPSADLEGWLQQAAEGNEALALDAPELPAANEPGERRRSRAAAQAASDAHEAMLQRAPARGASLVQMVEEQLALAELPPDLEDWVRFLIGRLDAAGFLSESDEDLLLAAADAGLPGGVLKLGKAIACMQALEPRGLGARDAIEAMLLQLDPLAADYFACCRLLEEFVEDLARNRLPKVASCLGVELDELRRLIDQLRDLDPRPVGHLVEVLAPVIKPDVHVEGGPGGFEVMVERSALPAISLDPEVAQMARDKALPSDIRSYLRGRVDEARAVVDAVQQRGVTLVRVSRSVFERQLAFLENGPGRLDPLAMAVVAEDLGLAVSTVSRAVSGKYVQTPWGIFPLRHFFQAEAGGVAQDGVRAALQRLVDGEDSGAPFSDDDLMAALERDGVRVARRTVAKYRKELGIPSSYQRRVH
ncbi:MAG: RNA polymerase sigma-54 factor [Planctomycetota bacterium]|jgi:RNA polymerase sigma-54 factor